MGKIFLKIVLIWSILINCLSIIVLLGHSDNVLKYIVIAQSLLIVLNAYFVYFDKNNHWGIKVLVVRYLCLFLLPLNFLLSVRLRYFTDLIYVLVLIIIYLVTCLPVIIGFKKIKMVERFDALATVHYCLVAVFVNIGYVLISFLAGAGA